MTRTVKVLNLGIGNLSAFINMHRYMDMSIQIVYAPEEILPGDILILVGNGSFDPYMQALRDRGIADRIRSLAYVNSITLIGFCIGAHVMGYSSEEGICEGLSLLPFHVKKLPVLDMNIPLPHMRRNTVSWKGGSLLHLENSDSRFYFLHSYFMSPEDDVNVLGYTKYGVLFPSVISDGNHYAIQFHPEKSNLNGMKLFSALYSLIQ